MTLEQLLSLDVQSVFGASKFLQRINEAPASVTVVSADEIARYGYRTLADVMRSVRGFYVSNDRSYSFVGFRGLQRPGDYNSHILVLVDGHRTNDNIYDQAYLDEALPVDLDDVERIEFIRGAGSSLYGSNAFFAVVNVVTRRDHAGAGGEVSVNAGTLGRLGVHGAWARGSQSGWSARVSGSLLGVQGDTRLYFPEFDSPATNFGVADNLDHLKRANLLASFSLGPVKLQAAFNERWKAVPTGAYGTVFNDPRNAFSDRMAYVDASYTRQWSSGLTLTARGFADAYDYNGTFPTDYVGDSGATVVENRDVASGRWAGGELVLNHSWGNHHLTTGGEYRNNFRQHQQNFDVSPPAVYLDDQRWTSTVAGFAQDQIRLGKHLLATVGARVDRYSNSDPAVTPRAALIVTPTTTSTLKLLYGEAFRAPNVYEMFYTAGELYKANPGVRPERIRTAEAAWSQYLGRHYRVEANVFLYRVRDLITQVTDPSDGMLVYENAGRAETRGFELELEGRWGGGLQVRASYSRQEATDQDTGLRLTNSPRHVGQAALSAPVGRSGSMLSLGVRALSSRLTEAGTTTGAHVIPTLTLFSPHIFKALDLRITLDNVFDRRYEDPGSAEFRQAAIQQNGRTADVKVTWRF